MRLTPSYLFLNYTSLCNSKCISCDIWKTENVTMPVDVFERADRFFDPVNLVSVLLCGGEPLLPESCVDMAIAVARFKPGVAMPMATNALVPDLYLERIRRMIEGGCRPSIVISLNGPPDKHDMTRGMPGNYEKCIKLAEGVQPLGILRAFNILFIPGVTTDADIRHVQAVAVRFGVFAASSPIMRSSPWFGKQDDGTKIPRFQCHAGNILAILPNADIVPCHEPRPELTFANLKDEALDWDKATRILDIIKSGGCQPCGICTNAYTQGTILT